MAWTPTRIKKLRQDLKLTQEGMAHRLRVTTVTINRWENGRVKPTGLSIVMLDDVKKGLNSKGK